MLGGLTALNIMLTESSMRESKREVAEGKGAGTYEESELKSRKRRRDLLSCGIEWKVLFLKTK